MPNLSPIPASQISVSQGGTSPTWISWFNAVYRAIKKSPEVQSGNSSPTTAPKNIGDLYVDTVAKKIYCATGQSSSSDWVILN